MTPFHTDVVVHGDNDESVPQELIHLVAQTVGKDKKVWPCCITGGRL